MNDSEPSTSPQAPTPDKDDASPDSPKAKKDIPVVSVPHEDDVLAQEMAELFEEDEVTHQHGSSEPEGD